MQIGCDLVSQFYQFSPLYSRDSRRRISSGQVLHWAKKKIVMLPSVRPKSENWVGRSIFFFFTYRERVEFSNIFLKVSKCSGKTRAECSQNAYTSAFLSH